MDIGFYISDLLRENDEVSVPGLGTFMKVRIPGSYDPVNSTFNPPSYQLFFRTSSSDYSLLKNYISDQKNLSLSSAEYFIEKFLSSFSDLLSASGFAEIKPLGIIHKKNETLLFEASNDLEIAGNFYGFKPLIDRKIASALMPKALVNEEEALVLENREIEKQEETEETEEIEETNGRSGFRTAVAIIIPLIIIGAILLYFFNPRVYQEVQKLRSEFFPVKEQPAPAPIPPPVADVIKTLPDSITEIADTLLKNSDTLTLNQQEIPPAQSTEQPKPAAIQKNGNFEIIGAAFGSRREAEAYIEQLAARGIEARIAKNIPGKLIKISLGSFKDEASATIELNRIHRDLNKDAWIYNPNKKP